LAGIRIRYSPCHLGASKVLIPIVIRFELAAVNCNEPIFKQANVFAQHDELKTNRADGRAIVFPKVSNGFEARSLSANQPLEFNVELRVELKAGA